jgi:hypothetical protein
MVGSFREEIGLKCLDLLIPKFLKLDKTLHKFQLVLMAVKRPFSTIGRGNGKYSTDKFVLYLLHTFSPL